MAAYTFHKIFIFVALICKPNLVKEFIRPSLKYFIEDGKNDMAYNQLLICDLAFVYLKKIRDNMIRRSLLKTVALGIGGAISIPSWANSWNQNSFSKNINFSPENDALLGEIVGTILPETATPGAKSLGVHKLIQKIVTDCQGKEAENKLVSNLSKFENLTKSSQGGSFASLNSDKKLTFLKSLENSEDSDLKAFYSQMKRMTIDGYMKSEYVMTNITKYEYAPARWNACVPV